MQEEPLALPPRFSLLVYHDRYQEGRDDMTLNSHTKMKSIYLLMVMTCILRVPNLFLCNNRSIMILFLKQNYQ